MDEIVIGRIEAIRSLEENRFAGQNRTLGRQYLLRRVQIDLPTDRADNVFNLCKMKFSKGFHEMKVHDEESLECGRDVFVSATGTAKSLHLTLIMSNGICENVHSRIFQYILTHNDLFQA